MAGKVPKMAGKVCVCVPVVVAAVGKQEERRRSRGGCTTRGERCCRCGRCVVIRLLVVDIVRVIALLLSQLILNN
jgi:hypothetical protein